MNPVLTLVVGGLINRSFGGVLRSQISQNYFIKCTLTKDFLG